MLLKRVHRTVVDLTMVRMRTYSSTICGSKVHGMVTYHKVELFPHCACVERGTST